MAKKEDAAVANFWKLVTEMAKVIQESVVSQGEEEMSVDVKVKEGGAVIVTVYDERGYETCGTFKQACDRLFRKQSKIVPLKIR